MTTDSTATGKPLLGQCWCNYLLFGSHAPDCEILLSEYPLGDYDAYELYGHLQP